MADDGEDVETNKDRQGREQDSAMNRMTDAAPERELDAGKVKQAMAELLKHQRARDEAKRARERELAAVKINREDVDAIVKEFEVDKKAAERRLREHGGDLRNALRSYMPLFGTFLPYKERLQKEQQEEQEQEQQQQEQQRLAEQQLEKLQLTETEKLQQQQEASTGTS